MADFGEAGGELRDEQRRSERGSKSHHLGSHCNLAVSDPFVEKLLETATMKEKSRGKAKKIRGEESKKEST
jgi:hypothetical protein